MTGGGERNCKGTRLAGRGQSAYAIAVADELTGLRAALSGRYVFERELGRGGMATVWLAEDLKNNRAVALKVLRPDLTSVLNAERFVRETKITGRLTHPHILPLFDSDKQNGFLYYVMPYVPGETLRQRLQREKQLPVDDALRITREVADALDYAHRQGVVHRDIKPENILLSEGHALVADFGIARAIAAAAPDDKLTETGLAVGTLHYMSPEQAAGDREIDGRTDIYALGCVLYEMLAGVPPFQGATAESVLRQHLIETPRSLATFRPGLDPRVERAILKALAKAPADRWSNGAEFLGALSGARTAVDRQPGQRSRRMTMAVLGGALAVVVSAALLRWLPNTRTANTLAVLYFDNLSDDSADVYLADGLTEEIIARLGEVSRLDVKSRTAVVRFRGRTADGPLSLSRALGATNLVDGSVRRAKHRLRVTVELVRATTGVRLWGAQFDRPDSDLLDVEADIATAVATAVAGRLAPAERESLRARVTRDPVAYDHYLHGNHYLAQRTARAVDRAINEYDSAATRDPRFVEALARQAYGYALFLYYGWPYRSLTADSLLALGQARADRALRVDSTLAEAWLARGRMLEVLHPRTYEGAIAAYRRAATLDPRDPEVFNMLGASLRELGDDSEAVQAFHEALALDPDRATTLTLLGIQASLARRYDEATRWADSALSVDPGFYDAYVSRGFYRLFLGDSAGAHADAQVALQFPTGNHLSDETLRVLLEAGAGKTSAGRSRVRRLLAAFDTSRPSPLVGTLLARACLAVGDRERALDLLARVEPHGAVLWFWLRFAGFDAIRADPRFKRIVAESQPPRVS
jgi:TolB-like protein